MTLQVLLDQTSNFIWGLIVDWVAFVSLFLTLGLGFLPLRQLGFALHQTWRSLHRSEGKGTLSIFAALMTALGGNVGTGSLAGIAVMLSIGGPGSLFWMWVITLVSLATKYSEVMLAVRFRSTNDRGELVGGPMYVMCEGLPQSLRWLGLCFAAIASLACFGLGNGVQASELANALEDSLGLPRLLSGVLLAAIVLVVIQGGVRRISRVSVVLVPLMVAGYLGFTGLILLTHLETLSKVLRTVVNDVFSSQALVGGSLLLMISVAVHRTITAEESGMGTTPIVHALTRPGDPVMQGLVAILGNLVTALVATMTALLVLCSESHQGVFAQQSGFPMVIRAFDWGLPGSAWVLDLVTVLFSFTTVIVFAYYGERCLEYLFGSRSNRVYRLVWAAVLVLAATRDFSEIWVATDILNGLMVLPNLAALVLLSGTVFGLSKAYRFGRS